MKDIEIYRDSGPVDMSELDKFEGEVGIKLPQEYKKLL